MGTFTLTITTDGAAFAEDDLGWELARILRDMAEDFPSSNIRNGSGLLRDSNGNTVGTWTHNA